jgi:hypothetical protein
MSQEFLNYLGIHVLRKKKRCAGVSKIMKANGTGQTCFL